MIRLTLLLLTIAPILTSCDKDPYSGPTEPVLPPITMEGKNTFGCKVNGKVWVAYQDQAGLFNPTLESILDGNIITIQARLSNKNINVNERIGFQLNIDSLGEQNLGYYSSSFSNFNLNSNCTLFKKPTQETIILNLHKPTSRIISGKFTIKNLQNTCGDTLNITEGRFDIKY